MEGPGFPGSSAPSVALLQVTCNAAYISAQLMSCGSALCSLLLIMTPYMPISRLVSTPDKEGSCHARL